MATSRPTLEELREFSRLPWVRCPSCGRVTGNKQERYDAILRDKANTYYDILEKAYYTFISQGQDDLTAQRLADKQAQVVAGLEFNRRVQDELGINDYCCFRTLQNPIVLPLGAGIDLDPEVDVGEKKSRPVLPEVIEGTPSQRRTYLARPSSGLAPTGPIVQRSYRAI